jgi:hypothetical protein
VKRVKRAPLRRVDDLLTDEQQAELRDDLARIQQAVRPCWSAGYTEGRESQ